MFFFFLSDARTFTSKEGKAGHKYYTQGRLNFSLRSQKKLAHVHSKFEVKQGIESLIKTIFNPRLSLPSYAAPPLLSPPSIFYIAFTLHEGIDKWAVAVAT